MAASDASSITLSSTMTDAEVATAVTTFAIVSGDIVITANHGGTVRVIKVKTA